VCLTSNNAAIPFDDQLRRWSFKSSAFTPANFATAFNTDAGGAGMYHVKELLGHDSFETIKHYAKLTISGLKKEHQRRHPREKDGCENA
jgi:site-specific recombinase XerD